MSIKNLTLALIGLNHRTSNVEDREKVQVSRKEIPDFLKELLKQEKVEGAAILSTCNRLEFYLTVKNDASIFEIVKSVYSDKDAAIEQVKDSFYVEKEKGVVRHLFNVITGLDSLVLGEYQIQGQVKNAYSMACQAETVDKILHKLFHAAFRTGKKVRSETSLGAGKQSVAGVASQIMKEKLDKNDKIAVIGVNENTKIVSKELSADGFTNFIFANRTKYKAEALAEEFGGEAKSLSEIEKTLFEAKAVFASAGAPAAIVSKEIMNRLAVQERFPKLIVDMAVPRNIEIEKKPDYAEIIDISALKRYLEKQSEFQKEEIPKANEIIENEINVFQAWSEMRTNKLLEPYTEKFEIARQQLMEEYKSEFTPHTFEKADKMSRSLVHRLQSTFVRALLRTNQELKVLKQHRDSM